MSNKETSRAPIRRWLSLVALLPAIGVALLLLKGVFETLFGPPELRTLLFPMSLAALGQLLIPLTIAVVIAWMLNRIGKSKLGILIGTVVVFAAYVFMYFKSEYEIAECFRQYTGVICGEWSFMLYLMWFGMCVVNAVALSGLGYWIARWSRHPSSSQVPQD